MPFLCSAHLLKLSSEIFFWILFWKLTGWRLAAAPCFLKYLFWKSYLACSSHDFPALGEEEILFVTAFYHLILGFILLLNIILGFLHPQTSFLLWI